ncbi:unnamed protein product, partial [Larinioides sclopetarius]
RAASHWIIILHLSGRPAYSPKDVSHTFTKLQTWWRLRDGRIAGLSSPASYVFKEIASHSFSVSFSPFSEMAQLL